MAESKIKETCLVTGGAGFIGSNLCARLLADGYRVICVDDYTLGTPENVERFSGNDDFKLIEADVSDEDRFAEIVKEYKPEIIYHLAANSDIQRSAAEPGIDHANTFNTTYSVLEAMRKNEIKRLFFASTSAIYGDKSSEQVSEETGGLAPISYYGGAKLASEAFISAYSYMNDLDVLIFRFPNVIGPGLTHGVIFDFIKRLKENPRELTILGDGRQCKPYLFVEDLVEAIDDYTHRAHKGVEIYNIGVDSATTVNEIADMVCKRMGLSDVRYTYTGGNVGWKGDVPAFRYDIEKILQSGWRPKHTSNEAVKATLDSLDI